MRPAECFLLAWAVLQPQFSACKSLPVQFVNVGDKVQIPFVAEGTFYDHGRSANWYKRGIAEGIPLFIKSCLDDQAAGRFVCNTGMKEVMLEISEAQTEDSGLYLCIRMHGDLHRAFTLVVGDSYTPSTQVTLLQPAAQDPSSQNATSVRLACVVQGVSNLVEVSWSVSGGLHQNGETFLVKNLSGSLTFVSLLPIPTDVQSSGGKVTCEVRLNSSGPTEKQSITFPAASPEDQDGKCLPYVVPVAGVGGLALLLLLLSLLWIRFCPSRPRLSSKISDPPGSDLPEEGLCYAQLDLPTGTQDRKKRK